MFCLRGGAVHRHLKLSQIQKTEKGYRYIENGSKNHPGGLARVNLKNKTVNIFRNPDADHCHCRILDLYMSKMPQEAKTKDLFYLRPMEMFTPDQWYRIAGNFRGVQIFAFFGAE